MKHKKFTGTGVALITPFQKNGNIDYDAYGRIIEFVIESGIDYLVPLGSTGESATISDTEQMEVLSFVLEKNAGRKAIIAGNFGGKDTAALCKKIESYDFAGIDGILSASPEYSKPSQEGIYRHYMALAESSPVPILIYNVPSRTRSNIEWDTTIRLANNSNNFLGIKEASGDLSQATKIIKNRPEHFIVTSGDDELALAMTSLGGDGVISVIANAYPKGYSTMIKHALNGNYTEAREINFKLFDLHKWLYIEGNPVGIKSAMKILGYCENQMRLPLSEMSSENYAALEAAMAEVSR